jgi:hypothetical protein
VLLKLATSVQLDLAMTYPGAAMRRCLGRRRAFRRSHFRNRSLRLELAVMAAVGALPLRMVTRVGSF